MSDEKSLYDDSGPASPSDFPAREISRDETSDSNSNYGPDVVDDEFGELSITELPPQGEYGLRPRRIRTPIILFVLTGVTTFWVGATDWMPGQVIGKCLQESSLLEFRRTMIQHWGQGLTYMVCVLSILMAHEMGHFVATVVYRIRASLPYFLPFPFNPIGTFGAVITMDAMRADRKQIFDIGIAGPLAGLVLAVPIMWYGVITLDLTQEGYGGIRFYLPMAVEWLMSFYQPKGYTPGAGVWISQLNPYFMAGWVGLLVTGLNMLPVSQLDGGHITYTLFGKLAHWLARAFMVGGIAYMVYSENPALVLMVILIVLIGTDHPPTRDDKVPLGWFRTILGLASLSIPILCFPPRVMEVITSAPMSM